MDEMNVEDSWNFFIDKISNSVEKHVPLKKVNSNRKKQCWVDADCLASIRTKHKAWNRYIHTQDRTDYLNYCKARNECTKLTEAPGRNLKSIIQNVKTDSKGFWGYVREKTKSRTVVSDLKDSNGELVSSDSEKAGHLFKIVKPRCHKNFRSNCFPVRCINKWNALSEEIVCSDTVLKFKTSLDKVLLPER